MLISPTAGRTRAWGSVLLLTLVGLLNIVDRILPSILVEPIKRDLLLSDTALGLINGFGFLVIYAVFGIPIARLSDRGSYGLVISSCLALWSAMTLLGGMVQTGWQLAGSRMGVALGEAGSTPAAHAFISRNFPPDRRGAPLAVLMLSIPLATLIALVGGGLLAEALGWRSTLMLVGIAGLLLAPVVLVVLGPRQAAAPSHARPTGLRPALLLMRKPSFLAIVAASSCIGIGGYSLMVFTPAFLMRVHGMSLGEVAVNFGVASGLTGIVSLLLTGVIADRLSTKDPRWLLRVVALMLAVLLPFAVAAWIVESRWLAICFMALTNVAVTAYLAPVIAAIQRLAPVESRAMASAILLFFSALMGGAGPFITGLISDALQPELGHLALGRAMFVVPVALALAAILYAVATRSFLRDLATEDAR